MENETKELLKKLNNLLGELLDKSEETKELFYEASHGNFFIKAENQDNKNICIEVKGEKLAILLGLAGLEKEILKELKVDQSTWEAIKETLKIEEVE